MEKSTLILHLVQRLGAGRRTLIFPTTRLRRSWCVGDTVGTNRDNYSLHTERKRKFSPRVLIVSIQESFSVNRECERHTDMGEWNEISRRHPYERNEKIPHSCVEWDETGRPQGVCITESRESLKREKIIIHILSRVVSVAAGYCRNHGVCNHGLQRTKAHTIHADWNLLCVFSVEKSLRNKHSGCSSTITVGREPRSENNKDKTWCQDARPG